MPIVQYAYGDESGIHAEAQYCVVAGYVGAPQTWESFVPAWKSALKDGGVEGGFHMRRFLHGRDEYEGWDHDKRDRLLESLVNVITSHEIHPNGCAVNIQDYLSLTEEQQRFFNGAQLQTGILQRPTPLAPAGYVEEPVKFMMDAWTSRRLYHVAARAYLKHAIEDAPENCELHAILASLEHLSGEIRDFFERRILEGNPHPGNRIFAEVSYMDASITPQLQVADLHATLCGLELEGKRPLGLREQNEADTLLANGRLGIFIIDNDYFTAVWEQTRSDINQFFLRRGYNPDRTRPSL